MVMTLGWKQLPTVRAHSAATNFRGVISFHRTIIACASPLCFVAAMVKHEVVQDAIVVKT